LNQDAFPKLDNSIAAVVPWWDRIRPGKRFVFSLVQHWGTGAPEFYHSAHQQAQPGDHRLTSLDD